MSKIWRPDTCKCIIQVTAWPVSQPNFDKFIVKCSRHNALAQVLLENQNENLRFGHISPNASQMATIATEKKALYDSS